MTDTAYEQEDEWDFWHEANLSCVSYNSEIDENLIAVFRGIRDKKFNSDIAETLDLPQQYVELLQSIFCSIGWCEYGTSPRGCWVDHKLDADALLTKLEDWYKRTWETPQ